jgi:hypothetical protein
MADHNANGNSGGKEGRKAGSISFKSWRQNATPTF